MRARVGWVLLVGGATALLVWSPDAGPWWTWLPGIAATMVGIIMLMVDLAERDERRKEAGRVLPPGIHVGDAAPPDASPRGGSPPGMPPGGGSAPLVWLTPRHSGAVRAIGIHHGRRLMAVGGGETVALWSAADPSRPGGAGVLSQASGAAVVAVAVSPDRRLLAVGGADRSVSVFDLGDPAGYPAQGPAGHPEARPPAASPVVPQPATAARIAVLPVPCDRFQDPACAVAFSPDGRHLVTADRSATVWDLAASPGPRPVAELAMARRWRRGSRCAVAFTADGRMLAVASRTTVTLWNMTGPGGPRRRGVLRPYGRSIGVNAVSIHSVAFDPPGRTLVTAAGQHTEAYTGTMAVSSDTSAVDLWDVGDPGRPRHLVRLDQRGATSLPRARTRGSGRERQRERQRGSELQRQQGSSDRERDRERDGVERYTGHGAAVRAVVFGADGLLATAGDDNAAILWDVTDASHPQVVGVLAHEAPVGAVAFGPQPGLLTTGCDDGSVAVWRYRSE